MATELKHDVYMPFTLLRRAVYNLTRDYLVIHTREIVRQNEKVDRKKVGAGLQISERVA